MIQNILQYLIVFAVGGGLCAIAQILVVRTRLTPARILVLFLTTGIVLEGFGVFSYIKEFAGAGVCVPIIGFGSSLAKGAIEAVSEYGIMGAFGGGLIATGIGVGVAVVASFIVTLIFSPKSK